MSSERDASKKTTSDPTRGARDAAALAADLCLAGHALPAGTQLHDYVITGLLGEGGFGIVYLAEDAGLQREVAIKEYLPSSMASRAKNAMTVLVKSRNHEETFTLGLRSFVNEARLLARFDHPALVKVHRFWEAHGTAYMVMPYYRGPTLKATLAELGRTPNEAELRQWLGPLMDALGVIHAAQCYHRDIAPDNILITENGPLLLDFGAARRVIGDMTHALTVVLKPGFAPIEQYGDLPGMTQGPWTDIYALASVLYTAISGRRPMPSVERLLDDRLRPLAEVAQGRFPAPFLQAIDKALALRPADRPQSIEAFRALLGPPTGPEPISREPRVEPAKVQVLGSRVSAPVPVQGKAAAALSESGASPPVRRIGPMAVAAALVVGAALLAVGIALTLRTDPAPAPPTSVLRGLPMPDPAAAVLPQIAAPAPQITAPDMPSEPKPVPAKKAASVSAPPPAAPTPAVPSPAAPKSPELQSKCSDILQKASLETLSADEKAFLRKECR